MKKLNDFLYEALVNESFLKKCDSFPGQFDLREIFEQTKGDPSKLKDIDFREYFGDDFESNEKQIINLFTNILKSVSDIRGVDISSVAPDGGFENPDVREEAELDDDDSGIVLSDNDGENLTLLVFKKPLEKLPSAQQKAIKELMVKYEDEHWLIEYFDAIN